MDVTQAQIARPKWFRWLDRLSAPIAKGCGGCGRVPPDGARYCPHCGKAWFGVGTSEEVELPAGRTATVAEGLLLVRYEPDSPAGRWRADGNVTTGSEPHPVVVVKAVGQPERVLLARPLVSQPYPLRWGPAYEVTVLDLNDSSARLHIRRTA